MNHLIVSREYPPCAYPQGGIGTYLVHVAQLLAERGETVHVIGEQWPGAPLDREVQCEGRLIVHRVPLTRPLPTTSAVAVTHERQILHGMAGSAFPAQAFSWQVARLAESLVETAAIDCIEAQEYEGPLYYFLLRRALGYGPGRRPPCFVHLHSPTQFIYHHNDWPIGRPGPLMMKRFEDYVISASDAALCPSQYLARQVERHHGLAHESITRIPYPKGDTPRLERPDATWTSGTICYFGRMEGRKGVFEWLDAAIAVARERRGLAFEFIGSDTTISGMDHTSVREVLLGRVPEDLRGSIRFLDPMPRPQLIEHLRAARMAVVPSRWENFPNTCVEAMSTGLPVLSSPEGGMVEMLEDGRTGWIAGAVEPAALAAALRRALDAPPREKAAMGLAAAEAIGHLCDNRHTIDAQIEFRRALAQRGASRSLTLPRGRSSVVWQDSATTPALASTSDSRRNGVAADSPHQPDGLIIVVSCRSADRLQAALTTVLGQTQRPDAVVIDAADISRTARRNAVQLCGDAGVPVMELGAVFGSAIDSFAGIAWLDAGCDLAPTFVATVTTALRANPSVGVVSSWHVEMRKRRMVIRAHPDRPYQWLRDDTSPCTAFRLSAFRPLAWLFSLPGGRPAVGDLALALLLDGWQGITVPACLSTRHAALDETSRSLESATRTRLVPRLRADFVTEVAEDVPQLLSLITDGIGAATLDADAGPTPMEVLRLPFKTQVELAKQALRNPAGALEWVIGHGRQLLGRAGGRNR